MMVDGSSRPSPYPKYGSIFWFLFHVMITFLCDADGPRYRLVRASGAVKQQTKLYVARYSPKEPSVT